MTHKWPFGDPVQDAPEKAPISRGIGGLGTTDRSQLEQHRYFIATAEHCLIYVKPMSRDSCGTLSKRASAPAGRQLGCFASAHF